MLKHVPPPLTAFQPFPEFVMETKPRNLVPVLAEPAHTDTTPDFTKPRDVEMRTYQILIGTATTLEQIVSDARLLERAGHTVSLEFTRRMDQNVDNTKRDLVAGPINGIRLSVVR